MLSQNGPPLPGHVGSICLTADSQPLLRAVDGRYPFLESLRREVPAVRPRAAYIGASNGDEPAFYEIFEAAMDVLQIEDRRMISSRFDGAERAFAETADLILLAGGDVLRGWSVIDSCGMRQTVEARHRAGAALVGVSAGAMQLGLGAPDADAGPDGMVPTLGLVPHLIDVHAEVDEWRALRSHVRRSRWGANGWGIPTGGAVIVRSDGSAEIFGAPILELCRDGDEWIDVYRVPR